MEKPFEIEEAVKFIRYEGKSFFASRRGKQLVTAFDDLRLPKGSHETRQCKSILRMLKDYMSRENPPRPLSIAVFGPPGSGKSATVKKLAAIAGKGAIERPEEINLSQFNSPEDLGRAMLSIFSRMKNGVTRMVFFDEFDSALDGEKLGWLKLFLAPMQDGLFYYDGKPIAIGRAIFVFAGGTSSTFAEFNSKEDRKFIECKGPDFVSRLRGFIDIQGVNKHNQERILRRSLVLYYQLRNRSRSLIAAGDTFNVDEGLLQKLLAGAHYIHESRSMEAVLDMCELSGKKQFDEVSLPVSEQMSLHVSRGELDGSTIGVAAGQDSNSLNFFDQFAKQVLLRGGRLAHGGDFALNGPLGAMVASLKAAPKELAVRDEVGEKRKRIVNYASFPTYVSPRFKTAKTPDIKEAVRFLEQPPLEADECDNWKLEAPAISNLKKALKLKTYFTPMKRNRYNPPFEPAKHLAWAIGLFRMRLRLVQDVDAMIVVGGKTKDGWGRFPGVVEEVLLSIVHKRPLFIVGSAKGASRSIGRLMGLDQEQPWDFMFDDPANELASVIKDHPHYFRVPHKSDLPTEMPALGEFLRLHGIDSEHWIDNGLTKAENRTLFASTDIEVSVQLIAQGLTRLMARGHRNTQSRCSESLPSLNSHQQ